MVEGPTASPPTASNGSLPISDPELDYLIERTDLFQQRVAATSYSVATKEELVSLQRSYRSKGRVSRAFGIPGLAMALGGLFPMFFGLYSLDGDGVVPYYEAPFLALGGSILVGVGTGFVLGPGTGFGRAAVSDYNKIKTILRGPANAYRVRPPKLHLALSPGSMYIGASGQF